MKKQLLLIIFFFAISLPLYSFQNNQADPQHIGSSLAYSGTMSAKLGDYLYYQGFYIGGFLEARNEKRFSNVFLPNHNWRGYGLIGYEHDVISTSRQSVNLAISYEHESAHPTMGMNDATDEVYQKIYDDRYRNINLNSLMLGARYILVDPSIQFKIDYHFYFLSRNTPELPAFDLTFSHGIDLGLEYTKKFTENDSIYLSSFYGIVFTGPKEITDDIYTNNEQTGKPAITRISYPVINYTYTISLQSGYRHFVLTSNHYINVYVRILYGNIYGFVDSRDKRLQGSIGIGIEL